MELRLSDVAVSRGWRPVLEGLSVAVPAGEALILRGPNGAGKTTLLRSVAGLQPPLAGEITPGPDAIAYATHSDGLKATLSVDENLAFWAEIYGANGFAHVLAPFDLETLRLRPAGNLSAGQKRRLGLARMMLTGRPVWLLDEPTVSLDAASVARFADVVRAHLATGGSAMIATHIDLGLEGNVLDIGAYAAKRIIAQDPFGGTFDDMFEDGA